MLAFTDVVFPVAGVTDFAGELTTGIGARFCRKMRYTNFYQGEIRWELIDDGKFRFYTTSTASDETIKQYIATEGGWTVLPAVLDIFARHRWVGAQEVMESATLFLGTLDLFEACVGKWLGKAPPVNERLGQEARLALVGFNDSYTKGASTTTTLAPASMDAADMPEKPTLAFFAEKRQDLKAFHASKPRGRLMVSTIIHKALDFGLKHSLYLAGERARKKRDQQTVTTGRRFSRLLEAASNVTENQVAQKALELLCGSKRWDALPLADRNFKMRTLAFRMLTREIACITIVLVVPHDNCPFLLFRCALEGTEEDQQYLLDLCHCLREDFTEYWLSKYPGDAFKSTESKTLLAIIAEWLRCESTSSECGHSYWQAVCRARSLQVVADSFESVSATSFLKQVKRLSCCDKVTEAPKPLGRKRKQESQKVKKKRASNKAVRKTRNTKQPRSKRKKCERYQQPTVRYGGWGPYRLYLHENKLKGVKGPMQFKGRALAYHAMKGTPAFLKLQLRAQALTHKRATQVSHPSSSCNADSASPNSASSNAQRVEPTPKEESPISFAVVTKNITGNLLNVSHGKTPLSARTSVRRLVRQAGGVCRNNQRSLDLKLEEWVAKETSTLTHGVFSRSVRVSGVSVQPGPVGVTSVRWRMPTISVAKALIQGAKEPGTTCFKSALTEEELNCSVHGLLQKRWTRRHQMYKCKQQKPLGKVLPTKLRASLGRRLGMCLCKQPELLLFRSSFIAVLRALYKKGPDNLYKALMEANCGVLRLQWARPDAHPPVLTQVDAQGAND